MSVQPTEGNSIVLIQLLKGIIDRESAPELWQTLSAQPAQVRDYFGRIGFLDDVEGYAYLRQKLPTEGEPALPRLIVRRQLSYPVSLLLALLRKRLAEHDATSGETRLVLCAAEITDLVRLFQPDTSNDAKLVDRIGRDIVTVADLGFLKLLKGRSDSYEVRRILRSFVDAQWLAEFNQQLAAYAAYGKEGAPALPDAGDKQP
jgi:Domain of unknown function (DUF4194)